MTPSSEGAALGGAASFVAVIAAEEFWDGEAAAFEVAGADVLLVRVDGAFHAYDDRCPHQSRSLAEGELDGRVLTCAAHGWEFDVTTGLGTNPCGVPLARRPVRVIDGTVYVGAGRA